MHNRFELFSVIEHYENLVSEENRLMMEKVTTLQADVWDLKNVYQSFDIEEVSCHIDAVCVNILKDHNDRFYLIDWEFDPLWDMATLFLSLQLNDEEEFFFLTYYLGGEPQMEELQRIHLLKIFLDYMWSLWYMYKEAKGNDYGNKALKRVERAEKHIELFRMLYDEDVVV